MPAQMVFELRRAHRRINRYRHPAGIEHAEKTEKVITRRRQHQRYCVAGLQAVLLQAAGDIEGALPEPAIGNYITVVVILVKLDMRTLGVRPRVPVEHLSQRSCALGCLGAGFEAKFADLLCSDIQAAAVGAQNRVEQIPRGFGICEDPFR